jgi:hypothetical protein
VIDESGSHERSVSVKATARSDRPMIGETTDKRAFVRRCLTDNPTMKVADIQRQANSQGIKIAYSYISDIRKAFLAEQGERAREETA